MYSIKEFPTITRMHAVCKDGQPVAWFDTVDQCKTYIAAHS